MFKIPDYIELNKLKIKINLDPNLLADTGNFGDYNTRTLTITLSETLSDQKKGLILLHEIIEAIVDIYALNLKQTEIQALGVAFHELLMQGKLYTIIEEE